MVEKIVSFDKKFDGRKGDEIKVSRGWRNLDGARANKIENITSGNTSIIIRGLMLDPPKELDPPLCGRVVSVKTMGDGSRIVIDEMVPVENSTPLDEEKEFDFFISHASEDKGSFVNELVDKLKKLGITVWYDNFEIDWGHDLRPNIDRGLKKCKYGIVVLSKAFLGKKKWTEYELNSLFARETTGKRMVFPIWHEVDREDVLEYSPLLADRIALRSHEKDKILEKCAALSGKEFNKSEDSSEGAEVGISSKGISVNDYILLIRTEENLRIKVAIMLGFESGLSLAEVKNLKREDIDYKGSQVLVKNANGEILRVAPLPLSYQAHHINYIPLPCDQQEIELAFNSDCKTIGLESEISFESLRNSFIHTCILDGMGSEKIMEIAGLKSQSILDYYIKSIPPQEKSREAIREYRKKFGKKTLF